MTQHDARPRLLDLYCGAGGCSVGYHRAGFDVIGVDLHPQPNYPYRFLECDALKFLELPHLEWTFDAIHASPPCQEYSSAGKASKVTYGATYVDLYEPTRELLQQTGLPWVIENVTAAPSRSGVMLCGSMVGLPLIQRHRVFESSHMLMSPGPCDHQPDVITVTGHSPQRWLGGRRIPASWDEVKEAMGIDWMTRKEIVQAIPPAYTHEIGLQLLRQISTEGRLSPDPAPSQGSAC